MVSTVEEDRMPQQTSVRTSIGRLRPHVGPLLPRWTLGLVSALGASIVALAIPQVLRDLVNTSLHPAGDPARLWTAVAIITGLGVLEAVLVSLRRVFVISPSTDVEFRMRTSFYRHLQQLPVAFHDRWGSGQLLSRAMADLGLIRRWLAFGALMLVVCAVTVIIGTAVMFSIDWMLGLVFLAAAVPIVYFGFKFRTAYGAASRLSQDQAGDLATTVEESVHGIRVLKAFGRGRHALENFRGQAELLRSTEIRKAATLSRFMAAILSIPELALGAALVIGIVAVADGRLTVGALVAFFATTAVVAGPVESLGPLLGMTLTAKTAIDRHYEVMDTPNHLADPVRPRDAGGVRGAVGFHNVTFSYPEARPGSPPVLDGVELQLLPGETMALVGITGSGKSTLLQLVPRLYDVSSGRITIDGADIRDYSVESLRRVVAVAFEDATLFSTSVRENVLLGARLQPGESPETVLAEALETAQAQFVYRLPEGVDTRIGEEGLSLSGGQRQRIALARAIAARPQVLVLDDPLSALDVRTEEQVTARLREVLADTTTLIVAHRPSTVALADRVALLESGRISAVGTHSQLLATSEHYRHVIASLEEEPLLEELGDLKEPGDLKGHGTLKESGDESR
jgi:ATP-binding cassette, subfamily B, bacterial